jgi:hypothetical protein
MYLMSRESSNQTIYRDRGNEEPEKSKENVMKRQV